MRAEDDPPSELLEALEPWRELLRHRAEFTRNPQRKWWETAWPRDRRTLISPKVIALHRTDRGRFALDELGRWQPSNRATVVTPQEAGLSCAYLCGLLNTELLDLWYALRGRTPRDVWRDYEPKPMHEIPYRHVVQPLGWAPGPAVAALTEALATGDVDGAVQAAAHACSALGSAQGDADAAAAVEHLVRAITANRTALLPLRTIAPELASAIKSRWRTHGVRVHRARVLADLPPAEVRSVRLDATLTLTVMTDGVLGRARLVDGRLVFHHASRRTARIEGPLDRLALLADVLGSARLMPDDLRAARVPVDLDGFASEVARRQREVDDLLQAGRRLVEAVERLVCRLYDLPDSLADQVVASAVRRAGTLALTEG